MKHSVAIILRPLGLPKDQGTFMSTTWADTGLGEVTRLKYAENVWACVHRNLPADWIYWNTDGDDNLLVFFFFWTRRH